MYYKKNRRKYFTESDVFFALIIKYLGKNISWAPLSVESADGKFLPNCSCVACQHISKTAVLSVSFISHNILSYSIAVYLFLNSIQLNNIQYCASPFLMILLFWYST